jgi:predicted metal-dependent enzyme (double-stranded beta helix superfamily)
MNDIDDFVALCASAVTVDQRPDATREIVERAVRDPRLTKQLQLDPGVRLLHNSEHLTVLHVVMPERPVGAGDPVPHNHTMWAIIGVTHGTEQNEFFQRSDRTVEPLGGRVVTEGEVIVMNGATIHSVKNPSTDRLSSALHVYGGDLIGAAKAMWCEPDLSEQPFDMFRVVGS